MTSAGTAKALTTGEVISRFANTQVITKTMLDSLPVGVARPTGQPGPGLMPKTEWQASPAYARVVYNLLTMTIDELESIGQMIPAWKVKQERGL